MANAHMKPMRTLIAQAALIYCQLMLLSRSFQSTRVLETGPSNFHLMTLAVMKEKVSLNEMKRKTIRALKAFVTKGESGSQRFLLNYCITTIPSTIQILYTYEIDMITYIFNIFCVSCKYLSACIGQFKFVCLFVCLFSLSVLLKFNETR